MIEKTTPLEQPQKVSFLHIYVPGQRLQPDSTVQYCQIDDKSLRIEKDISVPSFYWTRTIWHEDPTSDPASLLKTEQDLGRLQIDSGRSSLFPKPITEVDLSEEGFIVTTRYELDERDKRYKPVHETVPTDQSTDPIKLAQKVIKSQQDQLRDEPISAVKLVTTEGVMTCFQINPNLANQTNIQITSIEVSKPDASSETLRIPKREQKSLLSTIFIMHGVDRTEGFVPRIHIFGTKQEADKRVPLDISILQIEPDEPRLVRVLQVQEMPNKRRKIETKKTETPSKPPTEEVTPTDPSVLDHDDPRQFHAPRPSHSSRRVPFSAAAQVLSQKEASKKHAVVRRTLDVLRRSIRPIFSTITRIMTSDPTQSEMWRKFMGDRSQRKDR